MSDCSQIADIKMSSNGIQDGIRIALYDHISNIRWQMLNVECQLGLKYVGIPGLSCFGRHFFGLLQTELDDGGPANNNIGNDDGLGNQGAPVGTEYSNKRGL